MEKDISRRSFVKLASAGATKDVPPGEVWSGFPARPVWEWRRSVAALHDSRRKAPESGE